MKIKKSELSKIIREEIERLVESESCTFVWRDPNTDELWIVRHDDEGNQKRIRRASPGAVEGDVVSIDVGTGYQGQRGEQRGSYYRRRR